MNLGEWLRSLGLGQYEATFQENGVDAEVLPDLTDADLEKLTETAAKGDAGLSSADGARAPAQPAAKTAPKPHDAERRQLTVMFCDLVGSTAMSARLDPEDMRGVIAAYHKCCSTAIAGNGGFVAKYMGDGMLAYFGYPEAHEHDAEHAVRAGLTIVEAAPKLNTVAGAPLHVRVGIATGVVVVGDLLGSGEAQERGVVGDTPNLAARLQSVAVPDTVVIAESTRKLLGDLFELRDLGVQDLKGVAGPARAYAACARVRRRAASKRSMREASPPLLGAKKKPNCCFVAGAKQSRRRASRAHLRRGRHWQIAADGGVAGAAGRRAAYADALFLLAATHRQPALSDRRPHGAWGGLRARG